MRSDKAWYLLLYGVCGINKCMVFHKMNLTLFQKTPSSLPFIRLRTWNCMMEATNYLVTKAYCKITCEESKEIERFLAVVPQDLTNI